MLPPPQSSLVGKVHSFHHVLSAHFSLSKMQSLVLREDLLTFTEIWRLISSHGWGSYGAYKAHKPGTGGPQKDCVPLMPGEQHCNKTWQAERLGVGHLRWREGRGTKPPLWNHFQASAALITSLILTACRELLWHLKLNSMKESSQIKMKLTLPNSQHGC